MLSLPRRRHDEVAVVAFRQSRPITTTTRHSRPVEGLYFFTEGIILCKLRALLTSGGLKGAGNRPAQGGGGGGGEGKYPYTFGFNTSGGGGGGGGDVLSNVVVWWCRVCVNRERKRRAAPVPAARRDLPGQGVSEG